MTLSCAARDFVRLNLKEVAHQFTIQEVVGRRAENVKKYAPGSIRAVELNQVSTKEIVLDGIPCLEIDRPDDRNDLTLFFCFGGGMITGSPFESLPITAALANLACAKVICPRYRLAPEHPFPHGLDDVVRAYRALRSRGGAGGMVVGGESAGGNLILGLLQRLDGAERPAAAVLLSPWCDLTQSGDSFAFNKNRDPTLHPHYVQIAAQAYAASGNAATPDLSPLFASYDRGFPPTMITSGTRDLLLSDSVRLSRVLQRSGIHVDLRVWDGLWHVFQFYSDIPEARESLAEIANFLRSHAGCSSISTLST